MNQKEDLIYEMNGCDVGRLIGHANRSLNWQISAQSSRSADLCCKPFSAHTRTCFHMLEIFENEYKLYIQARQIQ